MKRRSSLLAEQPIRLEHHRRGFTLLELILSLAPPSY